MRGVLPARTDAAPKGLRRFLNPQDDHWHVQIMQGDTYVSDNAREVLTTILGSCIAACIHDREAGVGGMNHFLLPESHGPESGAHRFGVNAMELLINEILKRGGNRRRLQAKLFGGANVLNALSDIGSRNISFARQFLADEGIAVMGGDVGGFLPRRIQYWPTDGRARQISVRVDKQALAAREIMAAQADPGPADDVELF